MDYSGTVDYDVNTPFKYEGDDQDHLPASDGVDSVVDDPSKHMPVHHNQDDLIYPPLDFATPTSHAAASSSHVINSQSSLGNNIPSSSMGLDLASNSTVSSASGTIDHILGGTSNAVAMETSGDVAMETSDVRAPSSPESDEIPLAARRQKRPSRSTRSRKSLAEINEEEFDEKPPKGFNLLHDINPALVGTQSIFCSDVQKERRSKLTKGAKKKKKKEPEFCRFCFTNELSLQKIRSAKLPPSSSHPNTKLASLVTSVTDIDLCLSEKWTNPSFQLVCDDCVLVFSQFHEFRSAVQTNDTLLRRLYCSSKAKSKKPPAAAAATPPSAAPVSAATTTSSGKGRRRPNYKDPTSEEDSDARSIVSKKKTRGRRKGVTDDEETDGYLSSVSKTSKKSATSRRGASKKKKAGVTSDEETDGYMSSVSKKSTNTTPAAKSNSRKKRRYNSDSDNEDVKSDVSDGMDFGPSAYESFNIKQESLDSTDPREQKPIDSQEQSRNDVKAARKLAKKAKSARKQAKWNFIKSSIVQDAATKAQEELEIVKRRIKQEQEDSDEEAKGGDVFADSSWDDSSGVSSSEWSSVDDFENDHDDGETDGYLTSTSTRSTPKGRQKKRKRKSGALGKKSVSGNQTGCDDSETGGETDVERSRSQPIKVENEGMDALLPPVDHLSDGTESKKKQKRMSEGQMARRRVYSKKRMRLVKYFKKEQYRCKQCTACLLSYEAYLKHLKSVHHGYEISTLCYICGFSSSKRSTLAHHIQDHIQPKQKQKQICEICCAEVYHINGHIKDKHSGFFLQCPHCPKRFPRKTELTNHIKGIHLKHELRQSFVCEYCNKEFTFLQYLKRHMRTHTNEKPYKCMCGLGFNFNVSLKNHKQKCSVHLLSVSIQQQQQQVGR